MQSKHSLVPILKQMRKQRNITQSELAESIGIGQTAVANYESGKRFPDEKILIRIADYFEISLDRLVGRDFNSEQAVKLTVPEFSYSQSNLGDLTGLYMKEAQKSSDSGSNMAVQLLRDGYTEVQIMLDLLKPSLIRTGELWTEGRYNEAMEHQLSSTVVQSIIMMKALSYPMQEQDERFTALTAGGELHTIGLRMFSRFLELDGWGCFFLGSSVPTRSLGEYINKNDINLVLISATLNENADALCSMIEAVKSSKIPPAVIAGGNATVLNRMKILESGADYVFSTLEETIEAVRKIKRDCEYSHSDNIFF